jgi:hypothetical protein
MITIKAKHFRNESNYYSSEYLKSMVNHALTKIYLNPYYSTVAKKVDLANTVLFKFRDNKSKHIKGIYQRTLIEITLPKPGRYEHCYKDGNNKWTRCAIKTPASALVTYQALYWMLCVKCDHPRHKMPKVWDIKTDWPNVYIPVNDFIRTSVKGKNHE